MKSNLDGKNIEHKSDADSKDKQKGDTSTGQFILSVSILHGINVNVSFIRPSLEYASTVWMDITEGEKKRIENLN